MANMHGWEMVVPQSFEVVWDGGEGVDSIHLKTNQEDSFSHEIWIEDIRVSSNFGQGIITFEHNTIFRTSEGYNLWVTGSPNFFVDGAQALSALVETDWIPYTFTMNWKIKKQNEKVVFEEGDPYCFIFPIRRGAVNKVSTTMKSIKEDPKIEEKYNVAKRKRNFLKNIKEIKGCPIGSISGSQKHKFQGWYARGESPDGEGGFSPHQRTLAAEPFYD
jgi:hypothetical protein